MAFSRFTTRSALVNVMTAAIEKATRALVRDFGELEHLQVSQKSLGNFVSTADKRSETILITELQKARPQFGIITEESDYIEGTDKEQFWIIDPLDGTTNFLHGIPHFCISIALQMKDEIIAGVTYDPIKDEMFWAEKGKGAFLNQRRIRVSARRHIDEAVVGAGTPYSQTVNHTLYEKRINNIFPYISGVRRMGSTCLDLAYVACGRYDAFFDENMNVWDFAAGILLVKEAGGTLTTLSGGFDILIQRSILATGPDLYTPISKILLQN